MEYKEILNELGNGSIFDFVANNYWKLSKEVLKDIVKELDYATSEEVLVDEYKTIKENMITELKDLWHEDEDVE